MKMYKYFQSLGSAYSYVGLERTAGLRYVSLQEIEYIKKYMNKNKYVLDLGIGTGRVTSHLLLAGNRVLGIDGAESMLDYCARTFHAAVQSKKLRLVKHDLDTPLPFRNQSFDQVVCIRVIKYVTNWENCLSEAARVIKKKGLFIVEFPNLYSHEYISRIANHLFGIEYHVFSFRKFTDKAKKVGFSIISEYCGGKLPHFIYRQSDRFHFMRLIISTEELLNRILKNHLCRSYIIVCKRL